MPEPMVEEYKQRKRDFLASLGDKIRDRRNATGKSQTKLADDVEGSYSKNLLSEHELGVREMGIFKFVCLANALEVSPLSLIPAEYIDAKTETPAGYAELDEEHRKHIDAMIAYALADQKKGNKAK